LRRLTWIYGAVIAIALAGCSSSDTPAECAGFAALDPGIAASAAAADAQARTAKYRAIYGRHSIETPGAPGALGTASVEIMGLPPGSACEVHRERLRAYAETYNRALGEIEAGMSSRGNSAPAAELEPHDRQADPKPRADAQSDDGGLRQE
jgi:hypothetical protein